MYTPEDFRAEHERAINRANELRPRIVRAKRWDQIFASPEEAQADFQRYIGYRLFPDYALEELAHLKVRHPRIFAEP